jgi:hypothetical protein
MLPHAQPGLTRFEGYKFGDGTTLRMKASLYLARTGLYGMRVSRRLAGFRA